MGRIIVIEDNLVFRDHVCGMLEKAGYTTRTAYDCAGARKLLEALETDDIVLSDLRLPDGECTALLEYMRASGMRNPFVIMTDYAQVVSAVSSMKQGAADYIPKKLLQEKLMPMIRELAQKSKIRRTVPIFERRSATFQEISRRIALVAPTDMGVLILGENGTGKDHIAEKVHERSRRADRPFVAVDCGMPTGELAASELFGHRKGSFTGAVTDKAGCMEEADGGTLFLDEVGNLSYDVQVQLLRAIQERKIRPVGSNQEIEVDVRLVCATNENLQQAIARGEFREDLYHRLNEFTLHMPSLKDRGEDILLFANFFLDQANHELERTLIGFDAEASEAMQKYPWPGNLRQLKNVVKRATLLAQGEFITAKDLGEEINERKTVCENPEMEETFALHDEETEKHRILKALQQTGNNKTKAATLLGIDRKTLYNKLKLYHIPQ